jgi:hypothetical protein
MSAVKFDISQAEEMAKKLGIDINKAAKRAVLSTAMRVVQKITTVTIPAEPRPPIDRRAYAAGWVAKPTADGAMIQNTVPYASVIEYGARSENIKIGKLMLDALEGWVRRKGIGKGEMEPRQVAWAIAISMTKRGIFNGGKGLRILEKALNGIEALFAEELKREIGREL